MNSLGGMSQNLRRQIDGECPLRYGLETLHPFAGQPACLVQIAAEKRAESNNPMCGCKNFLHTRLLGQLKMPAACFPGSYRIAPRDVQKREKDRPTKQRHCVPQPLA